MAHDVGDIHPKCIKIVGFIWFYMVLSLLYLSFVSSTHWKVADFPTVNGIEWILYPMKIPCMFVPKKGVHHGIPQKGW